tara:strand:+ start:461 stop:1108 length:648 start_codon:yes stop_codon:yes gene_type:complete
MSKARDNYNKNYFNWYERIGKFGGIINKIKFDKYINKDDSVLDFGCGGGYLLKNIDCLNKHGVEINETAIEIAKKNSLKIFKNSSDIEDNFYDKIISNHALQHCENPFQELLNLHKALKKNGLIIISISCANKKLSYKPNDINYQLYSWSPMNIGNLLNATGFEVLSVNNYNLRWLPKFELLYNILGERIFIILCKFYGIFNDKISDIVAVAKKN